jgi:aryl-alcohol dehydrogenase-like predicted oxidoreductase
MLTRRLGHTDLELTTIGFGAWALGGGDYAFGWGPQDDRDSIRAIHKALDLGVNWIDTAPVYGLGRSEEVVGRALKGIRDEVIVATKCGMVWDKDRNISNQLTASSIRREVEDSLRRLNTEYIDLYQIHWPEPDSDLEEAWGEMVRLMEEGKIRYPAASNFSVAQLERVAAIYPVASLQPPYSLLKRGIETEILPYCAEKAIGVVAYSPMQGGLLTGKFTKERIRSLPDSDVRKTRNRHFQEPEVDANLRLVESLRPIADDEGLTRAQLALAWVLRRPEVTSAIAGTRKPEQIEETVQASDAVLDPISIERIASLLQERDRELASL